MHEVVHVIQELLLIFGISTLVVIVFHHLKQPAIAGFIISGILIGPSGLKLIKDLEQIQVLSELGIILLLFTLGIEFSIKRLASMKREFLGVGAGSTLGTTLIFTFLAWLFGIPIQKSLFFGFAAGLSSTAIVLKLLQHRRETGTPQGTLAIAVLLFQDMWIIPVMVLIPYLAPEGVAAISNGTETPFWDFQDWKAAALSVGKALLFIGGVIWSAKTLVPQFLKRVAQTRIRELFLISVFLVCLVSTWFSAYLGLSLALGAFMAGVIISDSEYGHQAVSDMIPFRDPFLALFFISIGMLLDLTFFLKHIPEIIAISIALIIGKFIVMATLSSFWGYSSRISALVGIMLCQVGEFSFVLGTKAVDVGVINALEYQYFLCVTILLMLVSPTLIRFAPRWAPHLSYFDAVKSVLGRSEMDKIPGKGSAREEMKNHVIIVGFGWNGQNLAEVLKGAQIPYQIIELNLDSVRKWKKLGAPIHFGDASRLEVLDAAGIESAKMVVVAISDPDWSHHIVRAIHEIRPDIRIIVRTQYLRGIEKLKDVGATDVVIAEVETSVEIFARVLRGYGVEEDLVQDSIKLIRAEGDKSIRQLVFSKDQMENLMGWLQKTDITPIRVRAGSFAEGKDLKDLNLRSLTGAMAVLHFRQEAGYRVPNPETDFEAEDIVYLVGSESDVKRAQEIFTGTSSDLAASQSQPPPEAASKS